MRARIRCGWELFKKSWMLVRHEKKLLVFPAAAIAVAYVYGFGLTAIAMAAGWEPYSWQWLALAAAVLYPLSFVVTFFGVAFVAMAQRALDREPVTFAGGFRCALARLRPIAAWALLSAGVGLLLQVLQTIRIGWVASWVTSALAGLAWTAVAFFAVPVLAIEDTGAVETLKRSARTFRQRWGEEFTGVTALAVFMIVALVPVMVIGWIAAPVMLVSIPAGVTLMVAAFLLMVAAIILVTTMTQLFSLVLYRYATTGVVPGEFTKQELDGAFNKRRGLAKRLFRRRA